MSFKSGAVLAHATPPIVLLFASNAVNRIWVATPFAEVWPGQVLVSAGAQKWDVVAVGAGPTLTVRDRVSGREETVRQGRDYWVCLVEA